MILPYRIGSHFQLLHNNIHQREREREIFPIPAQPLASLFSISHPKHVVYNRSPNKKRLDTVQRLLVPKKDDRELLRRRDPSTFPTLCKTLRDRRLEVILVACSSTPWLRTRRVFTVFSTGNDGCLIERQAFAAKGIQWIKIVNK